MDNNVLEELERATQLVLAPPDIVTSEQRHEAENVILRFRKTKLPYNICKFIMENSKCDYVLFQAATTIKEAIIREWSLLSAEDIESLRSFLLRYITQHISLQSYVREQVLQTVAVILKRGTIDTKGANRDSLFQDVTHLVGSGNVTMQLVACSMLTALLNEYSSSSRMSSVGFTWEFHIKCKRAFEENDLRRVFLFALQVLNEIEKQPLPLPRETIAVLNRLLSIAEHVLCWEFTHKITYRHHVGSFEVSQNSPLKPNENWRSTLLDKDMLQLFFKIHKKVRHNSEMSHHSVTCISQLASLNGPIFPDDNARAQYLNTFISGFLELLSSIDLQDYENLGVANTFKYLVMMFPISCMMSLPEDLLQSFLNHLTEQTCKTGRAAALEEALHRDDTLHMEAYERMLETWMELLLAMKDVSIMNFKSKTIQVFNGYVQCHISSPEGSRAQNEMESTEEIDELEEDDSIRFNDQLCSIGALGRMAPEHSIPLLARILENRVSRLHSHLQRLQQHIATHNESIDMTLLNVLYEDLHWIVMVATHVLTEEAEGETPMIPSDVMQYSISQAKYADVQTTLQVMASPGERVESIPGGDQKTDNVVRLVSAVFRLCEVENRALQAKLSHILSPQIGSTIMLFLRRWMAAYLVPDENYYAQISPTLLSTFGRDTEAAQWIITFLLNRIVSNLAVWNSEEKLMEDTLQLLVSLVDQRSKAVFVTKSDIFWTLAKQESNFQPPLDALSSKPRRYLLKALVLGGAGVEEARREQYWHYVLKSLHDRFYEVVCMEDFPRTCQNADIKELIISLLESLCGVATATRMDNLYRLYHFLMPLLQETVKLLDVYHQCEDVVPLCLELYSEVIQKQLCYLGEDKSKKLYEVSMSAVKMYSMHNKGKRKVDEEEEEDRYNDILLVMELLTNLLSKDFIDFSDPEEGEPQSGEHISAADVVLYGLHTIIPIMDANLLKFPTLCSQYFKLIAFLAEVHPEKFLCLDQQLFNGLMTSIELGLAHYGTDITRLCLEIVTFLASHVFQTNSAGSQMHSCLSNFLKLVFHMLLLETFDMDLLETASTALFCLICLHQSEYQELVNQLLQTQVEETYQQRLLEAFNNLTPHSLSMTITRNSKISFMQNFDHFLTNIRGFLCVK